MLPSSGTYGKLKINAFRLQSSPELITHQPEKIAEKYFGNMQIQVKQKVGVTFSNHVFLTLAKGQPVS